MKITLDKVYKNPDALAGKKGEIELQAAYTVKLKIDATGSINRIKL
jgi:hypothetical protein